MSTHHQWIIERKHENGKWYAVRSKADMWSRVDAAVPNTRLAIYVTEPEIVFSTQNYALYTLLTNSKNDDIENVAPIATLGAPADASDYARVSFHEDDSLWDDAYVLLGDLREKVADIERGPIGYMTPDGTRYPDNAGIWQDHYLTPLKHHLEALEALVADVDEMTRPLTIEGYAWYEPEIHGRMSAHERMAFTEIHQGFLPVAGDTVRILYSYDT